MSFQSSTFQEICHKTNYVPLHIVYVNKLPLEGSISVTAALDKHLDLTSNTDM